MTPQKNKMKIEKNLTLKNSAIYAFMNIRINLPEFLDRWYANILTPK